MSAVDAPIPPSVAATAPAVPAPLPGDVEALKRICSTVILPGDAAYKTARVAWNHDIMGSPSGIARPANAAEVAEVVKWAIAAGLGGRICIAGGRHSVYACRTDCLMLDCSALKQLDVDPVAKTADVR